MRTTLFIWLEPGGAADALLIARVRAVGVNETARRAALAPATLSRWLRGQMPMAVCDVTAVIIEANRLLAEQPAPADELSHIERLIGNVDALAREMQGVGSTG